MKSRVFFCALVFAVAAKSCLLIAWSWTVRGTRADFTRTATAPAAPPAQAFDVAARPPIARPIITGAPIATTQLADAVIDPPDIVAIEAIKVVPKAPYCIAARDVVQLHVIGTPGRPIFGNYPVDSYGYVNLGPPYGTVSLAGLTIAESQLAIKQHLEQRLPTVYVSVCLGRSTARQQIEGQHLVGPDGKISLGNYGRVTISGMTLDESKAAIERHLEQFLDDPDISLDVYKYSTKTYDVIVELPNGQAISRFSCENETVVDGVRRGMQVTDAKGLKVWVKRQSRHGNGDEVLHVDLPAIMSDRYSPTNYGLQAGDSIHIAANDAVQK